MLSLRYPPLFVQTGLKAPSTSKKLNGLVVCSARGPRPRYPRVWKSRSKIGTISKAEKLVQCIKGLSNVKEEVYGALDSFVAWELEFPLIVVKKALKTLEQQREWKRIIQVVKWMLCKGQGKTMGTYYILLNALAMDGRLVEAEQLWTKIFSENLESLPRIFFTKMISIYYKECMHENMFEIFADMEELGIRPQMKVVEMLGEVFQKLGMIDKLEKLRKKYPPPKWEYRYMRGKRIKVRISRLQRFDNPDSRPDEDAKVVQAIKVDDDSNNRLAGENDGEMEENMLDSEFDSTDSKLDESAEGVQAIETDDDSNIRLAGEDDSEMEENMLDSEFDSPDSKLDESAEGVEAIETDDDSNTRLAGEDDSEMEENMPNSEHDSLDSKPDEAFEVVKVIETADDSNNRLAEPDDNAMEDDFS